MAQDAIFFPMGALALVTFIVLILIPIRRFGAAAAGAVKADDFAYGESARVPGQVTLANRNYMNLLELPMLFYVICLMAYVLARVDMAFLVLAWGYVALRAVHSLIHVSYNNVRHRLRAFALSNFVLIGMWGVFFWRLIL
ncbi:MAG TPA: MAPEG family protein [Rhizomicrobium sp.]|nr:MAPEG family protein [Rhizomicrobium sp.]